MARILQIAMQMATKEYMRIWRAANKEKIRAYSKRYYVKNVAVFKNQSKKWHSLNKERKSHLNRKHNKTVADNEVERLFIKQGGMCPICGNFLKFTGYMTHLDHSHLTGKVRGLLCMSCNVGLGHFKDSTRLLSRAAYYLKTF